MLAEHNKKLQLHPSRIQFHLVNRWQVAKSRWANDLVKLVN